MVLEQLQEALPDGTRRSEDANPNLPHRCSLTHRMPAASIEHTYNRSARGDLPNDGPRRGMPGLFCFPKEQAMRASVTVRVAGSTSNLGAGFDCVGVAVGRWLRVTARVAPAAAGRPVAIERAGTLRMLDTAPEADLLYRGFVAACRRARQEPPAGLALTAESDIPVARGLGSSAAATVAGGAAPARPPGRQVRGPPPAARASELAGHPDS